GGEGGALADFFRHRTVAGLAPMLRVATAPSDDAPRSLVALRHGTAVPAVFCLPTAYGDVAPFHDLADRLADGQQLYGLQARGLFDDHAPLETVDEMATAYLTEILTRQPEGPYLLVSWSMGAYIAYELARRFTAMGHEVAGVVMVGPPYQEKPVKTGRHPMNRRERRLFQRLTEAIQGPAGTWLSDDDERVLLDYWEPGEQDLASARSGDKHRLRAARMGLVNYLAGVHYDADLRRGARPYDGELTLILSEGDSAAKNRNIAERW